MDLKECAAETTTGVETSNLMEATKPMEESSVAATDSLQKRKLDSKPENEESGDEDEESGDEDEETGDEDEEAGDEYVDPDDDLINPTWWKKPEWDVDSYDGVEYHSSQEENELPDEEAERKWRRYKRLVIESKGFYVEPGLRPGFSCAGIKPVYDLESSAGFGQTHREYFAEMACLCLQRYNHDKGSNVEFVEVVRGNYTIGSRSKSYITFNAREKPDGPLVEYQAKVWCTFKQGENYPILCRPASSANKPSNQN